MTVRDSNSHDSLEELLERLAPGVLRYCRARTGDPSLAEEVAQEALTALVSRWRHASPPDSPEAFVFAIARRRAGRALHRRRLLAPLEWLADTHSPQADPEARAAERQRLTQVTKLLAEFPARDREALLLAAAGDLDTATAARTLGISTGAYKMRLHRARRRLERLTDGPALSSSPMEASDESTP